MNVTEVERIRECFTYEAKNGDLHWKIRPCQRIKAGTIAGYIGNRGYRKVCVDGRHWLAHRLIWVIVYGTLPVGEIDHINRNKSDNRIENLRDVSRKENIHNTPRLDGKPVRLIGAYPLPSGRWWSRMRVKRVPVNIGTFDTEQEASSAYLAARSAL